MKAILITVFTVVILISTAFADIELDYYWQDYSSGPIPENALMVDEKDVNDPTYVGQVYSKEYELLPATIHTSKPLATFNAYNKELKRSKNIKVLCSQFKNNFKWVPTDHQSFNKLHGLVIGGSEVNITQYIGRIFRDNKAVLGKVGKVLALPFQGHEQYRANNFEILVYEKPVFCSEESGYTVPTSVK